MSTSKTILITGASTRFGRDAGETPLAPDTPSLHRCAIRRQKTAAHELHKQGIKVIELSLTFNF
jgi:hypothetical protein